MIAYLKGDFVYKSPAVVNIDVHGVGYEVQISLNTYSKIQNLDKGLLYTCLLIREDAHIFYGFFDQAEKEMFLQLLSVSGIGASTARVMLSYMKPDELAKAIIQADTPALEAIKGIGKKTAERIVVELRDHLSKKLYDSNISPMNDNTLHRDALNALTALGINRQVADQAVLKAMKSDPKLNQIEDIIKQALKSL
ncbi:MAG TPA: Holliday junction branch migration protein RuvA [Chitinophagaceae bacterium]|nr:Holliday junction branch migration protein RuvA [Chitinophagaceae bacterium]